MDSSHVK